MKTPATIAMLLLLASGCEKQMDPEADMAPPEGQVCLHPSKADPCVGASECDDDNKDCSPGFCSTGGGRFGVCVNRHCYWGDPTTEPGATPGDASCFVPAKGDECIA